VKSPRKLRVVALGGGHGLAASLTALRELDCDITAVVTVADDGGSSGRLRAELGALPPGDLRMALAALASDGAWERLLQHRFGGSGALAGHAVGNLLLTGLAEVAGDPVVALDHVAQLVGARGRVLPVSPEPLDIVAEVAGLDGDDPGAVREVRGQVAVATTAGQVVDVRLVPADPPASPEAVDAVLTADWLVFGPGSWFTSVLPHLLVPDLAKAAQATGARRLVALNLAPQPGETDGYAPEQYLQAWNAHAGALDVDVVLADTAAVGGSAAALCATAEEIGASLVLRAVARDDGSPRHDPRRLAAAYHEIFATGPSTDAESTGRWGAS
jgi:uncharacterized cofD-like protein